MEEARLRGNRSGVGKRQPVIDPALEKPLLILQRAMDVNSFWKAVQQLLSLAIPNRTIGLSLHHNPALPVMIRWTRAVPADFFAAEPLKSYASRPPRKKIVRLGDLFPDRRRFVRSAFYRRYMAAQKCAHGVTLFFWKRQQPVCVIAILRAAGQDDFSVSQMKSLRQLYPQFVATLRRIESLERERSLRAGFEEFLRRLPLPTIILRWNLKPVYQNRAAREFCAVWEKGPEEAKRTKPLSSIPTQILDHCRSLKQRWITFSRLRRGFAGHAGRDRSGGRTTDPKEEQVHHPRFDNLRAMVRLKQTKSARVARPHFLIACENLCRNGDQAARRRVVNFRLSGFLRLTRREREVAQLACEGRSNKEIAHKVCLSLPMVKKHLHSVFRKLEVPSRSRLVAMML